MHKGGEEDEGEPDDEGTAYRFGEYDLMLFIIKTLNKEVLRSDVCSPLQVDVWSTFFESSEV